MKFIIVSDIFGVTRHLITLAQSISSEYEIIDPYNGQIMEFESEPQAYERFCARCGLHRYTDLVIKRILSSSQRVLIVGFSVGASAVWNTLDKDCALMIEKAVCFYGSRIRDNSNLKPRCPALLIFPSKEVSFSVSDLSSALSKTYNVTCINTKYFHGFMNKCSDNFDASEYSNYLDLLKKDHLNQILDELKDFAIQLGASGAEVIASSQISAEDDLAAFCNGNPPCEQFAKAPSCPPHVEGVSGFRRWQKESQNSIVVKIDTPSSVLFSENSREAMKMLHEIVAGVELRAKQNGFSHARAFAGGSCKNIWCFSYTDCPVLLNNGECRNPYKARPSMSGFGINVTKLMQSAGWNSQKAKIVLTGADNMSWLAGLILL